MCKCVSCVSHCRRFAASGAMTAEEQEQRMLYTNVLEYEQDHVSSLDCHFFLHILSCCRVFTQIYTHHYTVMRIILEFYDHGYLMWIDEGGKTLILNEIAAQKSA